MSASCGVRWMPPSSAAAGRTDVLGAAEGLFEACIAAIPYAPATAFLANEQDKLAAIPYSTPRTPGQQGGVRRRDDGERPRVAILADGIGSTHGVTRTIEEIRHRGVPGFEIEVVGHRPGGRPASVRRCRDRRALLPGPAHRGPEPAGCRADAGRPGRRRLRRDPRLLAGPGRHRGALVAAALGLPLVGSYHTELTAYAGLRSGEQRLADAMAFAVSAFYGACDLVLSPSPASDGALAAIGMRRRARVALGSGRGHSALRPGAARSDRCCPARSTSCTAGRITHEKGADLLADAFLLAREREPRLHLVLAGGGPEQERLRERLGETRHLPRLAARATSWRARTRAPTSSCSRAAPTRSGR